MIETVYSIEEAREWFLEHSSGEVRCEAKGGAEQICKSFKEATAFFESNKQERKQ